MKRLIIFNLLFILFVVCSCSSTRNLSGDNLYNRQNEVKAKVKKGLLSSKYVTFGNFSTGKKEKDVDKNIIHFGSQNNPFHFSLTNDSGNTTIIQAVNTQKKYLNTGTLPNFFNNTNDGASIFYSWIRGNSANTLQNWELILQNPTYEGLQKDEQVGVLQTSNQVIDVHANNRFGSPGSYQKICYEFQLQGVPVAAVQVNGKNKVWIVQSLDAGTKFAIAGAIASILLR